ncbi:MAG TPA: VPLPA-CTERM sorting domain-containing protein [Gammaproteobacteria bacterium]|nr:VPLPA-CTERM sorting domain-containing protein [Gammaproteobacteria bacterium]
MDFLAFNGSAGTGVKISVASNTLGLDPLLEVWDPLGNLIESMSCNGNPFGPTTCTLAPELNLSETGLYRIGLSDVGWNETGNYSIGISCLFGDCPSAIPSPVPVPAAIWLFGSGLAGLCVTARRNKT